MSDTNEVVVIDEAKILLNRFGKFVKASNMISLCPHDSDESLNHFSFCLDHADRLAINDPKLSRLTGDGLEEPLTLIPVSQSEAPFAWDVKDKDGRLYDCYFYNIVRSTI
jgi:hypothetical protein